MIRLRTFGSPAVEEKGKAVRGAATQRKPLALLALLAVARERGLSRDKLLAYLWAETGPDRAPHRLNQVLYALRRDLSADSLFLGSTRLRLNPEVITSDVEEFLAAQQAGNIEAMVNLYAGPFLDGFGLRNAAEFERWMETERASLARACSDSLEALAAGAVAAGDHRLAAQWWRRLGDQDPFSSRVMVHLMHALAASGKRAEALKAAQAYASMMEKELDAAPSPAVVALAEQLRRQPGSGPGGGAPRAVRPATVAVLPLAFVGPNPDGQSFADGLTEEIMSRLSRLDGVRVVAHTSVDALRGAGVEAREIGHRLEAVAIVEGSVRQAGDRIRVTANLVHCGNGCRIWSATHDRLAGGGFATQDEVACLLVEGMQSSLATI